MHTHYKGRNRKTADDIIRELEQTVERSGDDDTFLHELYQRLLPEIGSVVRRYVNLDHALEAGDFMNEAYLAVRDALLAYRRDRGEVKFSTYVYWHFQKRFENLCCKDKVVVVRNDDRCSIMSYKEFQKIKRSLPEGTEWTVESRLVPLEPFNGTNGIPGRGIAGKRETEDEMLFALERSVDCAFGGMGMSSREDLRS